MSDQAHSEARDKEQRALELAQNEAEHREARRIRFLIALFAGVLLIAIVLSIQLSTLGVSFGTLVHGSNQVWRGHTATFRLGALDAQTSRLVQGVKATLILHDDSGPRATAHGRAHEIVELSVEIPANLGTSAELEVRIDTEHGPDQVRFPLRINNAPGPMPARIARHQEALIPESPPTKGPWRIALYPAGGNAVAGLDNRIHGRLTHLGQSRRANVRCEQVGLATETSNLGLFAFEYRPPLKPQSLAFEILNTHPPPSRPENQPVDQEPTDPAPEIVSIPLDFRPMQLRLASEAGPVVAPGTTVEIQIQALPFRNPIHVDAWLGDQLLTGSTAPAQRGRRVVEIVVPEAARGLMRVEAYRNLAAPASNLSTHTFWVSDAAPNVAITEAVTALAGLEGGDDVLSVLQNGPPNADLLGLALSRVAAQRPGMPLLRSNLKERRAIVEERVQKMRGRVHLFFALVLSLGAVLTITWVIRYQLKVRRGVLSVMREGLGAGDAITPEQVHPLARFLASLDLVLAASTVGLLLYGLWLLLTRITWL